MAFSLRRFLEIGTLSYVVGDRIAAVEEADSHTLRLRLSRPSTSLQGLLTSINLTPISPTAYSNHQDRFLHDRFVGTGPYKLTRFSEHQQRLEPFAQYWGEAPRNNGLDLITLSNSTALYGALRSGEVDLLLSASIDEDQRHTLHERASAGELHESVGPAMEIGYITLLSNREPFQDPNLRRALAVSLNRSEISERVSYGLRRPLRALVPPSLAGGAMAPWPEHNPEQARELLAGSGLLQRQHPALSAHLPLQRARRQIAGPHLAGPGATGPLGLPGVGSGWRRIHHHLPPAGGRCLQSRDAGLARQLPRSGGLSDAAVELHLGGGQHLHGRRSSHQRQLLECPRIADRPAEIRHADGRCPPHRPGSCGPSLRRRCRLHPRLAGFTSGLGPAEPQPSTI